MDRKLLPRGYAKIVSERLKVTKNQVYNVAYGRNCNDNIEIELLKLINERKEKRKLISELINAA